ncbi:MAG: hypothetical protein WBX01_08110 [Nitrososphaeraceae archaeon]
MESIINPKIVARKSTKNPQSNLAQGGCYSIVSENMTKTERHAQYSIVSDKIEQTETKKTQKTKRTKDI